MARQYRCWKLDVTTDCLCSFAIIPTNKEKRTRVNLGAILSNSPMFRQLSHSIPVLKCMHFYLCKYGFVLLHLCTSGLALPFLPQSLYPDKQQQERNKLITDLNVVICNCHFQGCPLEPTTPHPRPKISR